jgi:hypothetical protein
LTWKNIRPSAVEASGSPAQLCRLQNGRLMLLWNRFTDPTRKSGRREQLSMAFSEDDGRTWTEPVVLACDPIRAADHEAEHRLSYPYIYEHVPAEMWVTTMQGPLRAKVLEDDFLPRRLNHTAYPARWLPSARIMVDGQADEADWDRAKAEKRFVSPWKNTPAPRTEFRALCSETLLYFMFRIEDADVVVLDRLRDEEDAVFEDRAELYFSLDDQLRDYFCFEVDARGRVFDYRDSYYRRINSAWRWPGLETAASHSEHGYVIEGRIPLASLTAMGFPLLRPGVKIRCGLFRAEFSHDRSGKSVVQRETLHNRGRQIEGPPPIQEWVTWIDPRTEEPDFHVPTAMGWLQIVP